MKKTLLRIVGIILLLLCSGYLGGLLSYICGILILLVLLREDLKIDNKYPIEIIKTKYKGLGKTIVSLFFLYISFKTLISISTFGKGSSILNYGFGQKSFQQLYNGIFSVILSLIFTEITQLLTKEKKK